VKLEMAEAYSGLKVTGIHRSAGIVVAKLPRLGVRYTN
jgi:hypothetical protein